MNGIPTRAALYRINKKRMIKKISHHCPLNFKDKLYESPICINCDEDLIESPDHIFFTCRGNNPPRTALFRNINKWIGKKDLNGKSIAKHVRHIKECFTRTTESVTVEGRENLLKEGIISLPTVIQEIWLQFLYDCWIHRCKLFHKTARIQFSQ